MLAALGLEFVEISRTVRDTSNNLQRTNPTITIVISYENPPSESGSLANLILQWLTMVERLVAEWQYREVSCGDFTPDPTIYRS
jgi:hypothetical protein